MEFFCGTGLKRPVRLSEETREFAWRSLHGQYGDEAWKTMDVSVDDIPGITELDAEEQYSYCIDAIARNAPLRLIEEEKICGAATLGRAICHQVPLLYNGQVVFGSVSHLTLDFAAVLKIGINGLAEKINREGVYPYSKYLRRIIHSMRIWHTRYLAAEREHNPEIADMLLHVPFGTPTSFREAVQSLWFTFAFTRLCGNWPGIGRIDEILEPFLQADLQDGKLTLDEAREILAHFFIKGCEWIRSESPAGTGDAQHYQNIVLAGTNEAGVDVTGDVTYLVLDIMEELPIGDFPITVRLHDKTDPKLLRRVAEVIRYGSGVIAVYNEPLILRALEKVGYDPVEARNFANDGCWEVQIPGKTDFGYLPFDSYTMLMRDVLGVGCEHKAYESWDEILNAFYNRIREHVDGTFIGVRDSMLTKDETGAWQWKQYGGPAQVVSLFEGGCIENGRGYYNGGTKYIVRSPHIGGAPDAGNSLYAIRKLVYEDKLVTLPELLDILEADWEGYETLRQTAMNKYVYYGNDNPDADAVTAGILNFFADAVLAHAAETPLKFIPGVSTFGRQVDWLEQRTASPFGMKKNTILAGNCSPTPGTDLEGATAIIKSYCRADLEKQINGAALDIKLHPTAVQGENGLAALEALLTGFVDLGGYFMQVDVIDAEVLKEAQKNPEAYKTLSVRVSGWNARFVTLCPTWQDMIIQRTATGI
ncbi:MAG: hypothetical protein E7631_00900 [Ruminococcaceae bacterium]|nr:hypothetical protein [Oscillospiraceae bacterium]